MASVSIARKNGKAPSANGKTVVTAADLLRSAAKPASPIKHDPYTYDKDIPPLAGKVVDLIRNIAEMERELELAKDGVKVDVDPWYRDRLRQNGYESSVRIPAGKAVLRMTFQHRYRKLLAEREQPLRSIVGEKYDRYFQPGATVKIRKEITDSPEELAKVVVRLAKALGDDFPSIFEAEQTVLPTKAFTENRWRELDGKTNAALELAGVTQVVAFAEGK